MSDTTQTATKNKPALIAYFVPDREGADWIRIGAAWPHKDEKGFTLDLDLVPVGSGRINLRTLAEKSA